MASAVSDGVADITSSSEELAELHHHAWLVLQTGLGHAPRAVLHTIVESHAGFQKDSADDTFFMLRSRLEGVLPRGMCWRTFANHRSALVKLGLLELVWRAPNQHSDRSLWRIRYDRVLSAQPREQLPLPIDDLDEAEARVDEDAERAEEPARDERPARPARPGAPLSPSAQRQHLSRQIAHVRTILADGEERLTRLEAQLEALIAAENQEGIEEVRDVPRAERRRRQRRAAKEARGSPADSEFMKSVLAAMVEMDVGLSDWDRARFAEVEAEWNGLNPGTEIPSHFLPYALRRAREQNPGRYVGYAIGVLSSVVQQGYTEDDPPEQLRQRTPERYATRKRTY